MTTPDQPEESTDSTAPGNHSAPRPVPPLTPAPADRWARPAATSPEPDASTSDPAAPADPGADDADRADAAQAPTRVSAFPALRERSPGSPSSSATSPTSDDGDRASALDRPGPGRSVPPSDPDATTVTTPEPSRPASAGTSPASSDPAPTTALPTAAPVSRPAEPRAAEPEPARTDRSRAVDSDEDATRVVPLADPDQLAGSTRGQLKAGSREPLPDEEWVAEPVRRTAAHVWGVLGLLVAVPIAWFLITDGAQRTFAGLPPDHALNVAGPLSLAGGLAVLVIIALVTRVTSLGAWIWGGVLTLAGLAALIFPIASHDLIEGMRGTLQQLHEGFGTNVTNYLLETSRSGLLLTFGVVLLLLALVSHGARRSGRYEGRVKAEREARGL